MVSLRTVRLVTSMLVLVAGCRSHAPLCEGDTCDTGAEAGAGGDAAGQQGSSGSTGVGGDGSGSGGDGGAGNDEPECRRDGDCSLGTRCDGDERCVGGVCVLGEPVECLPDMVCEAQGESVTCLYEQPSPWLLIASNDRIVGLPRAQIVEQPLFTLLERGQVTFDTSFFEVQWSPTGENALAFAYETEFGTSLTRFRFGAGLPERAQLDELPNWLDSIDSEVSAVFSVDGERLAVDAEGLFLLQLEGAAAATRWFQSSSRALCAEPNSWLASYGVVSLVGEELLERPLAGEGYPSPDTRWIIEAGTPGRLVPCAASGDVLELGSVGSVVWSSDSRYAAIALDDGGLRVLSLEDPAAPVEVWSHAAAEQHGFDTNNGALLIEVADADTFSLLTLDGAEPAALTALSLEADACVKGIGADLLLAHWPCSDEGANQVVWLPLHEPAAPESISPGRVVEYDAALGLAVLDVGIDDELVFLQLDRESYRLQPLLIKAEGSTYRFHFSPDAQGLVVTTAPGFRWIVDYYPIDTATGDLQSKVQVTDGGVWVGWQPWR
jgi:hypothetical protein